LAGFEGWDEKFEAGEKQKRRVECKPNYEHILSIIGYGHAVVRTALYLEHIHISSAFTCEAYLYAELYTRKIKLFARLGERHPLGRSSKRALSPRRQVRA
jgi:hypothetical protein